MYTRQQKTNLQKLWGVLVCAALVWELWAVLYLNWAVLDIGVGRFGHVQKLWAVLAWAVLVLGRFGIDPSKL